MGKVFVHVLFSFLVSFSVILLNSYGLSADVNIIERDAVSEPPVAMRFLIATTVTMKQKWVIPPSLYS